MSRRGSGVLRGNHPEEGLREAPSHLDVKLACRTYDFRSVMHYYRDHLRVKPVGAMAGELCPVIPAINADCKVAAFIHFGLSLAIRHRAMTFNPSGPTSTALRLCN